MKHVIATVGLVALTACAQEAGYKVDGGNFGNAVANNQLIHTNARGYAVSLGNRFSNEVPNTVNFAFNSAQLDDAARTTLREQAKWISQFPEVRFKVYGHTDLVGSNSYNRSLGQRRANTVVNYLVSQGISRSRLEAVVSFGESQPLVVTQGRERRNRRTVTDVSGFVGSHPVVLDGKYAEVIHREYIESAKPETDLSTVSADDSAVDDG